LQGYLYLLSLSVQVAELEAEFEKLAGEKTRQVRFLRSQQDLRAKMEEQAAAAEEDGDEEEGDGRYHPCNCTLYRLGSNTGLLYTVQS